MVRRFRLPATLPAIAALIIGAASGSDAAASRIVINGPSGSGFGSLVTVLPNGNFVVATAGTTLYLYRADGTLIQSMPNVGNLRPVPLGTNEFLLINEGWNNGAGAVTRVDATIGLTGPVSAANSIVGGAPGDNIGHNGVVVLANGDYVVCSAKAKIGGAANAGAVTRVSGSAPVYGVVSAANSLVGSQPNDQVGNLCVQELTNGNYVVRSPNWSNATIANAGAATWCSGTAACTGAVSPANSLVGSHADDLIGETVTVLANGNYVVSSPSWTRGAVQYVGAVAWGNGATGTVGTVSADNALVGARMYDNVGSAVFALRNGNYVVASQQWDNGDVNDAGAVTWGSGNGGLAGNITSANSLVGSSSGDRLGGYLNGFRSDPVVPLPNGNYVVNAMFWSRPGAVRVGAVFVADGSAGTTGTILAANALVGSSAGDTVGAGGVRVLANGNFVVGSPYWKNGTMENAGAATWCNGDGSTVGPVSAANSLVGSATDEFLPWDVTPLANGHYVVTSPRWLNAGLPDTGAVTWGNGNGGTVGTVSMLNSIVGTNAGDSIGREVIAVGSGSYAFWSWGVDSNGLTDNGAVTLLSGAGPSFGAVPISRSLVGASNGDHVGSGGIAAFADGNFAVFSDRWDVGASVDAGAVTLLPGNSSPKGTPATWNSDFGATPQSTHSDYGYDAVRHQLVVGRAADDRVTLIRQERIFADGYD